MSPLEQRFLAHLITLMIPVLSTVLVLGVSFAIAGTGNRRPWILGCSLVAIAWTGLGQAIYWCWQVQMLALFWALAFPVVLCVGAWLFRRSRELGLKGVNRAPFT